MRYRVQSQQPVRGAIVLSLIARELAVVPMTISPGRSRPEFRDHLVGSSEWKPVETRTGDLLEVANDFELPPDGGTRFSTGDWQQTWFLRVRFLSPDNVDLRRTASGECYVATWEGRLVGTVTLVPPGRAKGAAYYERPGVCAFQQFAVDPGLQGRGIGARLMDTIEARAAELGATEIALDTSEQATELIRRYERRGYRIVDRLDWDVTNYLSVVMAKPL